MTKPISHQVEKIMENLVSTVELAEEAPDFVASAIQTLFDDYADQKLEQAAAAVEHIDGGAVSATIRALKKNAPQGKIEDELRKRMRSAE
jgi:hypothetical protein